MIFNGFPRSDRNPGPKWFRNFLAAVLPGIVSGKAIVSGQVLSEKQLLNAAETAELLSIRMNTLDEWVARKKIPHLEVGRLTRFSRSEPDAWLEKRKREEEDRNLWYNNDYDL